MSSDVVTNAELPELRASMLAFASDPGLSVQFRSSCIDAIESIDEAVAADAAINARLKLVLDAWKLAADAEVKS